MQTIYDAVPYPSPPRPATHPIRFAAPAALLGLAAPSVETARVLEIGCGEGGNLIAMAVGLPDARFHGFDLAPTAIAVGQAEIDALGLSNVRLETADILAFEPDGPFDYVIAHGVYAWTPAPVRESMMALIGRCLSPDGAAFISYNVAPGCHVRRMIREGLLAFMGPLADQRARLEALPEAASALYTEWAGGEALHAAIADEVKALSRRPQQVIFHDELGDCFEPQGVAETAAHAAQNGLQYLCDSQIGGLQALFRPNAMHKRLMERAGGDWVRFEQLSDVAQLRRFRQSVFVRAGRNPTPAGWLDALRGLYAQGEFELVTLDEAGVRTFRIADGQTFKTNDAELSDLLLRMSAAFPQAVRLGDLIDGPDIADRVLTLCTAMVIQLQTAPLRYTPTPGERPLASPLARRQAAAGQAELASLAHMPVRSDADSRRLLTLLDGVRDRAALAEALDAPPAAVENGLRAAARLGLLQA